MSAARFKTDLHVRVMRREIVAWRRTARLEGVTLSEWIRQRLNLAASASGEQPAVSKV